MRQQCRVPALGRSYLGVAPLATPISPWGIARSGTSAPVEANDSTARRGVALSLASYFRLLASYLNASGFAANSLSSWGAGSASAARRRNTSIVFEFEGKSTAL